MSAEGMVKRVMEKWRSKLYDDPTVNLTIAIESAIREALLEMAGKLEASGANAAAAIVREEAERG